MQVILGSGGAVGRPLALALAAHTSQIRLSSRQPHPLPDGMDGVEYSHFPADLLDERQVLAAVEGCEVAYLCAGLPYETAVWQRDWPRLMHNVIEACAKTGCKLVFLDNVYAYATSGYADLHEEARLDPPSAKGLARKQVREMLMDAIKVGRLQACIGVSADFYGPAIGNSLLNETMTKRLKAGQNAQWLINADLPHSFTFTPDAGHALARLGNDHRAWGEVWHLPTDASPWTARDFASALAREMDVKPRLQVMPQWLFWVLSRFNPFLREVYEMRDQLSLPYRLNASKYTRTFGVEPTPYQEGVRLCAAAVA